MIEEWTNEDAANLARLFRDELALQKAIRILTEGGLPQPGFPSFPGQKTNQDDSVTAALAYNQFSGYYLFRNNLLAMAQGEVKFEDLPPEFSEYADKDEESETPE